MRKAVTNVVFVGAMITMIVILAVGVGSILILQPSRTVVSVSTETILVTQTSTKTSTVTATSIETAGGTALTSTLISTVTSTVTSTSAITSTVTSMITSTISSTTCTTCSEASITATGTLSVPGGSGAGTLVFTVENNANSPITELVLSMPAAAITSYSAGGVGAANQGTAIPSLISVASDGVTLPVSPVNPLNPGEVASGAIGVSGPSGSGGLNPGNTYTFIVTATFVNGSNVVQSVDITAQL